MPVRLRITAAIGLGGLVIAAAAFAVVRFESPPGEPAHTFAVPEKIGCYVRDMNPGSAPEPGAAMLGNSGGRTSSVAAAYQSSCGNTGTQIVTVVEEHLPDDSPSASIAAFDRQYPDARPVNAGVLGGQAACAEAAGHASPRPATCAFFDDDSDGFFLSVTMDADELAGVMLQIRPAVELTVR